MRYRVPNIPLWLDEDDALLARRVAERLGVEARSLVEVAVVRRSLDARKKGHVRWLVNLEVVVEGEIRGAPADVARVPEPDPPPPLARPPAAPPIVLGAGPAGLFCAWALLERG
ncbi:MAG TPA: FAD-dependent oxidoreductase, partial [Anaeromyxobacteraceae bacterium]|nr:FAD-dependent oxidoreductase [Anaeromyxobacteraceae bacterium]